MEKIILTYGFNDIEILIIRKPVKNITLRVKQNSDVIIIANTKIEFGFLEEYCKKKLHWIFKQLNKFDNFIFETGKIEFVSGETVRYLGKQYRLKIIPAEADKVKWFRGYIHIFSRQSDNVQYKQKQYEKWLRQRIQIISTFILEECYKKLSRFQIDKPNLKFRKMKKRWGSCLPQSSTITLNTELIITPKHCIEYVIMHELIHLIHPNHSENFYNLLTLQIPDWMYTKQILDEKFGMMLS